MKKSRFQSLYNDYYAIMVAFAMRFVKTQDEAEDVVQDVFALLWVKADDLASKNMLVKFLYVSIRNKCLDILKHAEVERAYTEEFLFTNNETDDVDSDIFAGEVYRRLFKKIDELPERQRMTIQLAMQGKSNAEIAKEMNVAIDTVKSQKMKAYRTLRSSFSDTSLMTLLPCLFI